MEKICIDVAIPNYNSPFLAETIDSVLNQEEGAYSLNIYVVDDGSNPNLLTKVQNTYEVKGIKFHSNANNLGLAGNFNRCIELTKHPYVHILHADDMVTSSYYKTFAKAIQTNSDLALIACQSQTYNGEDLLLRKTEDYNINGIFEHLKLRNCLVASSVMLKTDIAKSIQFRKYAPHTCDWDMWARITANNASKYITECHHTYRVHESNDTFNYPDLAILNADLLLLNELYKDGIFTKDDLEIGKKGLLHSAKYSIAKHLKKLNLKPTIQITGFILKTSGFVASVKLWIFSFKTLLTRTR